MLIGSLFIANYRSKRKTDIVAGEFRDNFKRGLSKWEFGEEGWKIEKDVSNRLFLSVSKSSNGGITKRNFVWADYEFTFDVKVVDKNAGFIVQAENRSRYIMIQLNFEKEKPRLRLHLKTPGGKYSWYILREDEVDGVEPYSWIKTKIKVAGSNIDVYMDDRHMIHYFIDNPLVLPGGEQQAILRKADGTGEGTVVIERSAQVETYSIGGVGFRCSGKEHAHFRNVRVSPIV